jgi:hypothetical protein
METGLQGNIFARSFTTFGCLASHSWMKILWQYSRKLRVSIELVGCESVPLTRDGDIAWIDKLANMGFKGASLVGMNRVRKLKQVHSVSDTTACDGYSLLPEALTTTSGKSDREWSIEQPTKADFRLWSQALSMVYECDGRLRTRLGSFIAAPHINNDWTRLYVRECPRENSNFMIAFHFFVSLAAASSMNTRPLYHPRQTSANMFDATPAHLFTHRLHHPSPSSTI